MNPNNYKKTNAVNYVDKETKRQILSFLTSYL